MVYKMFKSACVIMTAILTVNHFAVAQVLKQKNYKKNQNTYIDKKLNKSHVQQSCKSNCKNNDQELLKFSHAYQAKEFREFCEQNPDVCKRFMRKLAKYITHKKTQKSRMQKTELTNINTLQKMQIPSEKINIITDTHQNDDWKNEIPAHFKTAASLSAINNYRLSHQNSSDLRKELNIFKHKLKRISVKS